MDMKTRELAVEAFLAELPQIIEKFETVIITKDGKPYAHFHTLPADSTMQNWEASLSTEKDEKPLEIQHVAMSLESFRADFQNLLEHEERVVLVVCEGVPVACFQGYEFRLYLEVAAQLEADNWKFTPQLEKSLDQAHLRGFTRFLVLSELVQPLDVERSGEPAVPVRHNEADEDALIEVAKAQHAQLMEHLEKDPVALARHEESLAQARRGEFAHLASLAELRKRMGRDKPAVPVSPDEVGGSPEKTAAVREATLREVAVEAFLAELPQIIEKFETVILTKNGKPCAIFQTLPAGFTMAQWENRVADEEVETLVGVSPYVALSPDVFRADFNRLLETEERPVLIVRDCVPIACFRGREFRMLEEAAEVSRAELDGMSAEERAQLQSEVREARAAFDRGEGVSLEELLAQARR